MSSPPSTIGSTLKLFLTEPGESVGEEELHEWYDDEHIPRWKNIPGVLSCVRLVQTDGKSPKWGVMFLCESIETRKSQEYSNLRDKEKGKMSEREREVLNRFELINARWYVPCERESDRTMRSFDGRLQTGNLVVLITFTIPPEHELELDRWYEEENLDLIGKVPGWLHSRRMVLQWIPSTPVQCMTMHWFESVNALETEELKKATGTTWRGRVMGLIEDTEHRFFVVVKTI